MSDHNVSASKFIYGLSGTSESIGEALKIEVPAEYRNGRLFSGGYVSAESGSKSILLSEKIYNLDEIRQQLDFHSGNNAALVLELIRREGIAGCRRLNGKFTIILPEDDSVTIIRDRNGEGPVIYFTGDFFTDSYRRLKDFRNFRARPDMTGLTTFLKIGYIPAPCTSLEGVSKVPAGTAMNIGKNGVSSSKLFDFEEIMNAERKPVPVDEAVEKYSELLKKSLRLRIGDASTIGVLLSGGYDSGGNIAMSRMVHQGEIKTYSIGFRDNPASELPYAKQMAAKFGADHHEYVMDGGEIEFLPEIIDALGDPFSESGFMLNHAVMKMVSTEGLPVIIGGDGNDQYFGAGLRETALRYSMQRYGLTPFSKLFDTLSDNSLFDSDNLAFRIHFQNQKILRVMEPETFGFHDFQLKKMFDLGSIRKHEYIKLIPKKFNSYEELFLQRNYYLHLQHSVNEVILFKASRMSDYFKVNLAFSYTDLDIYDFLQHLPVSLRAKGSVDDCIRGRGVAKYIHKQLVKPMLPGSVTNRPKQGGFSPLEIFFNVKERREAIYRYIRSSAWAATLKKNNFLDDFFRQYEALASGKPYWFWYKQVKSNQLINMLIVAIWWDRVIENRIFNNLSDYIGH